MAHDDLTENVIRTQPTNPRKFQKQLAKIGVRQPTEEEARIDRLRSWIFALTMIIAFTAITAWFMIERGNLILNF